jgi:predicted flap endonuclease-1-like 5' DNA nuclease
VYLILVLVALVAAVAAGYVFGRARRADGVTLEIPVSAADPLPDSAALPVAVAELPLPAPPSPEDHAIAERARIIRSLETEAAGLRREITTRDAALTQLRELAAERERLFAALGEAKADTARYRQLIVDLENSAPPPLLGGPGTPDDLKLIVGVGPVLERMLYQLGITTYRQIARWSERDIDEFDARLPEFPGRIRRDGWVTQARAIYQSKYGEPVPMRDRA